jgi:predicted O-methyltransferase YrrM
MIDFSVSFALKNVTSVIRHPKVFTAWLLRRRKIQALTGAAYQDIIYYERELRQDRRFIEHINKELYQYSQWSLGSMLSPLRAPMIYVICRVLKPENVVETGVAAGVSSAFILKALSANSKGRLYSIDIGRGDPHGVQIPEDKEIGWIIPSKLRHRWTLIIGSSRERLGPLLDEIGTIDLFLHDSEHTYENMLFEFRTVYPKLREGGVLLADNVDWNSAFFDFARSVDRKPTVFYNFGGMRK